MARTRRNAEQMYPLVASYLASGRTQKDFCEAHNLSTGVLGYWLSKYREKANGRSVALSRLRPRSLLWASLFARVVFPQGEGFDGLNGLVTAELGHSPLLGNVFVFINRRRTHIKLLVWDHFGLMLYHKRLEGVTCELPKGGSIAWHELVLMPECVNKNETVQL